MVAIERVKAYFRALGKEKDVLEFASSSATVELAARALGTEAARIAKTLAFHAGEGCVLIVMAGDAKADNKKFKEAFGVKAKMLAPEEVLAQTGHAVGGTCPFALSSDAPVYLDVSLQRFRTVFPACGSANSAIELTLEELFSYSSAKGWIDIGKGWARESRQHDIAKG